MKFYKILLLSLSTVLSGCSFMDTIVKRGEPVSTMPYVSLKSAVTNETPLATLKPGEFMRLVIQDNISPKVILESDYHYFEIIELFGEKDQEFLLGLYAKCDCLGFRKWTVLTQPFLLGPNDEEVEFEKSGSLRSKYMKGVFPTTGNYKFVVVANSTHVGKSMGKLGKIYLPYSYVPIQMPLTVHPTGEIILSWE